MIKFKKGIARRRLYLYDGVDVDYNGKYLTLPKLAERTECVVSKGTLSQRLSLAINTSGVYIWNDTIQCMSTPCIQGHPAICYKPPEKRQKPIDEGFLNVMMMMPLNNEEPRIMQSKEFTHG